MELKLNKTWDVFAGMLEPKVAQPYLERHVGDGTKKVAMLARKRVREYIKAGVPTGDGKVGVADLTWVIKNDRKPIVGTKGADLFNSIAYAVVSWKMAVVGSNRGTAGANIARIVHEGTTIKVTKAMRGMFMLLSLVDRGHMKADKLKGRALEIYNLAGGKRGADRQFYPIMPGTKVIVIPPRRYLEDVVKGERFMREARDIWAKSYQAAVHEQASRGELL